MSVKSGIAKAASATLTWGLKNIARRPAGNLPGKIASKIDPEIISELRGKISCGSIVVVGTNGKTTVTNMLADSIEASGKSVLCNRTGANLNSGIASALLQGSPSEWGVIECDELWSAKVVPQLRPTYFLLLNLFRDQLDRCGEIDRIQDAIISALHGSPDTTLIYNADDPLCEFIAQNIGRPSISFGISESMGLEQNQVSDATMCQKCSHMFEYEHRQYGQLGAYVCPNCGFARPVLDFSGRDVHFTNNSLSMKIVNNIDDRTCLLKSDLAGTYMAYNLLAVYSAAHLSGASDDEIQRAIDCFDPHNGRLQRYFIDGRKVLLNLAKNPTGFNQNLRIITSDKSPKGVAFFINDEVVDGHDISWIWDIDFEELCPLDGTVVFAGGKRRNDLQVRLKYAGIDAHLIDHIEDAFKIMNALCERGDMAMKSSPLYAIANYSALPPVKHALDHMSEKPHLAKHAIDSKNIDLHKVKKRATEDSKTELTPIVIAHILPDLLNLYGDGGNVRILAKRLQWRGIPVEVREIRYGEPLSFDDVDLVFLGGGPDREQKLVTEELFKVKDEFKSYIDAGGPLLAICGGYQILGRTWLLGDDEVEGLAILEMETRRPGTSADRLVSNIALDSKLSSLPVIGYENHAGRTYLDEGVNPFGTVLGKQGSGNTDDPSRSPHADGAIVGNILGTYLHGALLSKNPEVADWLLNKALKRHRERTGEEPIELSKLDDSVEEAANAFMAKKLL